MVAFFALNIWAEKAGIGERIVALLVTISVVSAHLPKIISLFLGRDTDFRKEEEKAWDVADLRWYRIVSSLSILLFITWFMIPAWSETLKLDFKPTAVSELFSVTLKNFPICVALGLLQLVFSWPDRN
jgi:hypothetical protein